jgi:hypothetical protein
MPFVHVDIEKSVGLDGQAVVMLQLLQQLDL